MRLTEVFSSRGFESRRISISDTSVFVSCILNFTHFESLPRLLKKINERNFLVFKGLRTSKKLNKCTSAPVDKLLWRAFLFCTHLTKYFSNSSKIIKYAGRVALFFNWWDYLCKSLSYFLVTSTSWNSDSNSLNSWIFSDIFFAYSFSFVLMD